MLSSTVVALVILHLHVSDTLREDSVSGEKQRVEGELVTSQRYSKLRGSTQTGTAKEKSKGGISVEDEDLLDLMVRIAETPAEWERIHRVLSQIGAEQESYKKSKENFQNNDELDSNRPNGTSQNLSSTSSLNASESISLSNSSRLYAFKTENTTAYVQLETEGVLETNYQNGRKEESVTDTGWPDFEEAIAKKIKKPHQKFDENDVLEEDWLSSSWLDTSWNDFLGEQNDHNAQPVVSPSNYQSVSFNPTKRKEGQNIVQLGLTQKSKLYSDPKILQFPIKETPSTPKHSTSPNLTGDSIEGLNRDPRPVFLYHRVTTGPQQRSGNSAFIAVSVVKQSSLEPPATTQTPAQENNLESPWSQSHDLPISQAEPRLTWHDTVVRKQNQWGRRVHNPHNRGRRHHRQHTHPHTHTHTQSLH